MAIEQYNEAARSSLSPFEKGYAIIALFAIGTIPKKSGHCDAGLQGVLSELICKLELAMRPASKWRGILRPFGPNADDGYCCKVGDRDHHA